MRLLPALAVSAVAAAALAFAPAAAADDVRLTTGEIAEALSDTTAFYLPGGDEQYFGPDGKTTYWDGARLTRGEWWAGGNQYCSVWGERAAPVCYAVLRRSNGDVVWVGESGRRYVATLRTGNRLSKR